MAEIYLAKLLGPGGFEKFLIIKKIHPELSGERQFVEMFVAEAKTLVSLSHGNIVPIYELGMVEDSYFIAMEYIDGPTLEQLLKARDATFTPTMAAHICAELLKGLDYAHRKGEGVIHRDLSPRNVMISREGEVKIVDFGIAIARAVDSDKPTRAAGPAGSYPYMSPEQVRGEPLDPRSDVFATGILLWEMLTGRNLFARKSDEETLAAVTDAVIAPPSESCPKAAGVLDAICKKALERELGARYQSAGEFLVAINRFLYSQLETVTPAEISRFVASTCPPQAHGRPDSSPRASSTRQPERSGTVPIVRSGTVPMERSAAAGAARAKGKVRADTVRSFATHVAFEKVLANATPMHGVPVIDDTSTSAPESKDQAEQSATSSISASSTPARSTQPGASAQVQVEPDTTQQIPKQQTSGASKAIPALLGAIAALGVGGIALLMLGKSEPAARDSLAKTVSDASVKESSFDAGASIDAGQAPPDAAVIVDAAPPADAKSARKKRSDAHVADSLGSLRVGASPWADVYLDGKKIGRAPGSFDVSVGKHTIELRYKQQSKTIEVEVSAGQLTSLGLHTFAPE